MLAALGKTDFGLYGVVGGMTVIVMLAYTMRLVRVGITAAENMRQAYIVKHIRKGLTLLSSYQQADPFSPEHSTIESFMGTRTKGLWMAHGRRKLLW